MWTTLRASSSRLAAPVTTLRQLSTTAARQATVGKRDLGPNSGYLSFQATLHGVWLSSLELFCPRVACLQRARRGDRWPELISEFAQTPAALLDLMGRDATKRLGEKAGSWEQLTELYKAGTEPLRDAGVGVKDRK